LGGGRRRSTGVGGKFFEYANSLFGSGKLGKRCDRRGEGNTGKLSPPRAVAAMCIWHQETDHGVRGNGGEGTPATGPRCAAFASLLAFVLAYVGVGITQTGITLRRMASSLSGWNEGGMFVRKGTVWRSRTPLYGRCMKGGGG